jgi:signal transduction histidine kinase
VAVAVAALALLALVSAGLIGVLAGGTHADARWREIEEDVRATLDGALRQAASLASSLAADASVPRALLEGTSGTEQLFRSIEARLPPDARRVAVTIFDATGTARAWHGRPSEIGPAAAASSARFFATGGPLGFRLSRLEPVVEPDTKRHLGAIVVEEIISEDRVGGLTSDAFLLHTEAGATTIRPAPPGGQASGATFLVRAPSNEPLVLAYRRDDALADAIAADRSRAAGIGLSALALLLLFFAGSFLDRRARAKRAFAYLGHSAAVAGLLIGARVLSWWGTPSLGASSLFGPAGGSWPLFLRSPGDLCLSGALWLALSALLADIGWRARVALKGRRVSPRERFVVFAASQLAAAGVTTLMLAAVDALLARAIDLTGAEALSLSLYPVTVSRFASLFGVILAIAGAVWTAVAVLVLSLAPWRIARRAGEMVVPVLAWAAAAAVVARMWRTWSGSSPSLTFFLAVAVVLAAGLLAARVTTRYRRAGPSARLLALAGAFLAPAIIGYPALVGASQDRLRSLIEHEYSRGVLHHRDDLLEALRTAREEIDRLPALAEVVRRTGPRVTTDEAFAVWSQTALARARLTSSLELYGADGRLMSRFALNFPEYEASAQVTRSETCAWRVFGEARPFGAAERAALHAERGLCGPNGEAQGSIVVHVMLDYNDLTFISSESPYREVFRPEPAVAEPAQRRPISLVIYGWSLLPVYTSGVQLWPIDDELFARVYSSRRGFWAPLESSGGTHHVYLVNDRQGIYALGFAALTLFDHLVHLAELVTLASLLYVFGLAIVALFDRVARERAPSPRALLRDIRASFYRKLLIAFVVASVIPVLALALAIRTYFTTRLRADVNAEAARTATVAQHALEELAALLRLAGLAAPPINDDLMVEVSQMIGRDVNVFEGPSLVATSQRDLFASGLLATRTPEDVYRDIILERRPTSVGEDVIGDFRYMVAAAPVSATGRDAIVTVPLASRQREIEREIEELDRGLLLAVLLFILVGAAIGLPTAERIADPVRRLTRAARRVAHGDFETRVAVRSVDELRRLVDAFNSMAGELKAQQQQLERTHRLEAWAEMARQVAHEIKNPLTPIQLSAEHLRRVHADRGQPLSPVLEGCIDSILGQVRLLRQIAGEFSSFASSPTARPARLSVAALVDEVVTAYRTGLDGRIELHVDVAEDLPDVMADRTLIGRALTNIIENALHAMPGRGSLSLTAAQVDADVALAVRDTGAGMDDEALSRVFEPYFSTKAAGTGLGLTIARRNVELSGGTIGVQSRRGEGTTVTIRLRQA